MTNLTETAAAVTDLVAGRGSDDPYGLAITLTGMTIVFVGLAGICVFIALLPKILAALERLGRKPEPTSPVPPAASAGFTSEELAAMAYVVHMETERLRSDEVRVNIPLNLQSPWALSDRMRTFPTREKR